MSNNKYPNHPSDTGNKLKSSYYIGYSTDKDIRFRSSSGGIGSLLIKHLLATPEYGTAMTFVFNRDKCAYEPRIIYKYDDYNNCGSIYQDTDNIQFLKDNLNKIKDGIIITCMPCQVRPIRCILNKNGIRNFIISLCCSGQTTIEGTWCYYKFLRIEKKHIVTMQYRGNGWPSGIQITLDDGKILKYKNWSYPWTIMHSSLLFRPHRCLNCIVKSVPDSDITLADPWLKEYEENDSIGNSVVISNTEEGYNTLMTLLEYKSVILNEVDEETYYMSQKGTIEKKKMNSQNKRINKLIKRLSNSKMYMRIATSSPIILKAHIKGIAIIKKILSLSGT